MNRRRFLATTATAIGSVSAAAALAAPNQSKTMEVKGIPTAHPKLTPPANGAINVAMVISEGVNVIDLSGPWGVFESVNLPNGGFDLMTVAETMDIVSSSSGLKIKPDHVFADAPAPQVVVIPAQNGSASMRDWLKKVAPATDVTMSVCTGAFHLAKAGLLNGKAATTHHEFLDKLEKQFPEIQVKRAFRRKRKDLHRRRSNERNRSRATCRGTLLQPRDRPKSGRVHGVSRPGLDRVRAAFRRLTGNVIYVTHVCH
jgi:putative intracellular protease/amidase